MNLSYSLEVQEWVTKKMLHWLANSHHVIMSAIIFVAVVLKASTTKIMLSEKSHISFLKEV